MSVYRGKHLVLGANGKDGVTFTPSVSAEGVLSWTNDGNLDNPQPIFIKGEDGKDIKAVDCTRAEYDAMEYHDPNTYYNIIDEDNGLATHEADGLMSKEDKIKLDGMSGGDDTINGIPVDLTGIYNTQVIGYDEESRKLVPMVNVARTLTLVPSSLEPKPWEITEMTNCKVNANEQNINLSPLAKGLVNFKGFFKNSYIISEFTTMAIRCHFAYVNSATFLKLSFSKQPDFSTIDAEYQIKTTSADIEIINLIGEYYIKFEMQTNFINYSTSYSFYISDILFK